MLKMHRPFQRDTWILAHYGEEIDGENINYYEVLDNNLSKSLAMLRKKFSDSRFSIKVRNVDMPDDDDLGHPTFDFVIYDRKEKRYIAEIEYWPDGYEPETLEELGL